MLLSPLGLDQVSLRRKPTIDWVVVVSTLAGEAGRRPHGPPLLLAANIRRLTWASPGASHSRLLAASREVR